MWQSSNCQIIDGKVVTIFKAKYDTLVTKTILLDNDGWDETNFTIPLGFNFYYYNQPYSTLYGGYSSAIDGTLFSGNISNSTVDGLGLFADLSNTKDSLHPNNINSSISYTTDIVSTKKIVKVEYNHCGFFDDTSKVDHINMQTWLYEKDSAIEIRIGQNQVDGDMLGTYFVGGKVAFYFGDDLNFGIFSIKKLYTITSLIPTSIDSLTINDFISSNFKGLPNYPDSGFVIRIAPIKQNVGIHQIQLNENIIINTVIDDILAIQLLNDVSNHQITILDWNGKIVTLKNINNKNNNINCNHLSAGNYILGIANANATIFYKFIKK